MKNTILILISTLFLLPLTTTATTSIAHHGDVLKVRAKNYDCADLQQLVQEEGVVHIKGFGSLNVYANARSACSRNTCFGDRACEPFVSRWRTNDKFSCQAGYACRVYTNNGR